MRRFRINRQPPQKFCPLMGDNGFFTHRDYVNCRRREKVPGKCERFVKKPGVCQTSTREAGCVQLWKTLWRMWITSGRNPGNRHYRKLNKGEYAGKSGYFVAGKKVIHRRTPFPAGGVEPGLAAKNPARTCAGWKKRQPSLTAGSAPTPAKTGVGLRGSGYSRCWCPAWWW